MPDGLEQIMELFWNAGERWAMRETAQAKALYDQAAQCARAAGYSPAASILDGAAIAAGGRFDDAVQLFDHSDAMKDLHLSWLVPFVRGLVEIRRQRFQEAIKHFERALSDKTFTQQGEAMVCIGRAHAELEDYGHAL